MHKISPADELADIRSEIARLQAREADLGAQFLAQPDTVVTGRWTRVEVVKTVARTFDASLLPPGIMNDPHYWREHITAEVRSLPGAPQMTPRPGWPIRREAGAAVH